MKLHRTNINLYEEDVEFLERFYGYGWTEHVREEIHRRVRALRQLQDEGTYTTYQEPSNERD